MRKRILMAAAVACLSATMPTASVASSHATNVQSGLGAIFRSYRVVTLDPAEVWRRLDTGRLTLSLGDRSYDLRMTPVTAFQGAVCLDCGPGGGPLPVSLDGQRAAFHGTIAGRPESKAFVGVTASSIQGMVEDDGAVVAFETAQRFDPRLSRDQVVVYSVSDLVDHGGHVHAEPAVVPSDASVVPAPSRAGATSSSSRVILIGLDSTAWNGNYAVLFNAVDHALTTQYSANYGFSFDWSVTYCTTAACDATWGMTSADPGTLLAQSSTVLSSYIQGWGKELAHVISAKGTSWQDCGAGMGYDPGRYSAQVFSYTYCGWYPVSVTVGHEVGHNFNGNHAAAGTPECPSSGPNPGTTGVSGRARCWSRWFSNTVYVCPVPFDVVYEQTGVCALGGHYEDQGSYRAVRSMMWWEGISNWVFEESSDNQTYIWHCNYIDWSGGTYVPGAIAGYGTYCLT